MSDVVNSAESTPAEVVNSAASSPAAGPDLSPLTEGSNAVPSAEVASKTVNPASGNQPSENQVPWGKDPRWQSWQKEEKALRTSAQQGDLWIRAFKEHPEFAQKVFALVNEFNKPDARTNMANQPKAPSHADPVVNELLEKIQNLEGKLTNGEKYLNEDRFEKAITKYKGSFDNVMKESKVDVLPEYQEMFEQNVWRNLIRENPEVESTFAFDEETFTRVVQAELQRYQKLTNGIVSRYTGQKLKNGVPQTMSGGVPLVNKPAQNEAEEDANLANAIKSLAGG